MIEPNKLKPFTKFCVTLGMIPSSYKASLTYEEQLIWFCDYLENTVIPAINNNAEALTEVQNLFLELKNYVDNYFENLDVQEEINNKLDEMVTDGTIATIINQEIFNELNNKIDNISESTLYNVVDELPSELNNNTQYDLKSYESEVDIEEFRKSNYELLTEAKIEANKNLNDKILRVGTFNIYTGSSSFRNSFKVEKFNKILRTINKLKCNILGLNEIYNDHLFPLNEFLTNDFYKYINMCITWENILPLCNYGEGTISQLQPSSYSTKIYNSYYEPEYQGYIKSVFSYDNKIISFYATHLCYNDLTTVQNQLNELYTDVMADENPYKIIVGDFNFNLLNFSQTYLSSFLNAGFKQVNAGQYKTLPSNDLALDEILVSSNIDILESGMLTLDEIDNSSDHLPIWANLKLN